MATFAENYRESDLTFDENGIYWTNPEDNEVYQVMMKWEEPIMKKMAELAVNEGDNVLEIGFGMGILSDEIQKRKPKSHTIIECHKDIIPKLKDWAKEKSNIIIKEGRWLQLVNDLPKYDAILFDTYGDEDLGNFVWFAVTKANKGCKITWYNNKDSDTDWGYLFDSYQLTLTDVTVNPPTNKYYNKKTYKVPLKII
tara:strand:- start:56 stop:646 length:591 start_codon:yes stop_codon:yes gene_type:complete